MEPYITGFMTSEAIEDRLTTDKTRGVLHIVNPLNNINLPFLPATYSFFVSFSLLGMDPEKDFSLEVELIAPNELSVFKSGKLALQKNESFNSKLPKESNGFMCNLELRNVVIREQGKHMCNIYIDEKKIGSFPISFFALEGE